MRYVIDWKASAEANAEDEPRSRTKTKLALTRGTFTVVMVDTVTGAEVYRGPGFSVPEVLRTLNAKGLQDRDRAILEVLAVKPGLRTIHMPRGATHKAVAVRGWLNEQGFDIPGGHDAPQDIGEDDIARLVTHGWIEACPNGEFYRLTDVGRMVLK